MSKDSGFQVGKSAPQHYHEHVSLLMAPFVAALIDATVGEGDSVLDVACGTGFATRAAAAVAGPGSRVEGLDLNPSMVAQARLATDDSGAAIGWHQGSGMDLPFADNEFDSVICQQGLQFFPDPAVGVREMARVTRPGGRLGVTVWSPSEQSPFLHHETEMLAHYGGGTQADFGVTGEQLTAWFETAGLTGPSLDVCNVEIELPPLSGYLAGHLKSIPWSAGFFELPQSEQAEALAALEARLDVYRTADGCRIPFSSLLMTVEVA